MKQPEIPKIAPRETKVWGQELFGKKPELTDEQLALIAEFQQSHDERIHEMLFPSPDMQEEF